MLIAEELLLLLLDDDSGKLHHSTYLDAGIGGALLVELALGSHVEVVKGQGLWARAKVHVTSAPAPSDPVLADALAVVGAAATGPPRTWWDASASVGATHCSSGSRPPGSCGARRTRVMGLFPRRRWPAADSRHEADLRRRLGDAWSAGSSRSPASPPWSPSSPPWTSRTRSSTAKASRPVS